ncbi:MAG: sialate O-acetylesterase [Chitinophagaceae bacterium]
METKSILRSLLCLVAALHVFFIGLAQLKVAAVFADHMVLQRRMKVPVWGSAKPGDKITLSYNSVTASATAKPDGSWMAYLDAMEARSEGTDLTITAAGSAPLVLHDVLVGEVWLCSGQSNMRMEMMYRDDAIPGVVNWESEVKEANYPLIRFYNRFREKGATLWEKCDTGSVKLFSAVAYYFGREIFKDQQVPVGLIHQSAGGTSIQKWIPETYFSQLPWARQYLDYSQYVPWLEPGSCYDNFIASLAGFGIRGAIWYQGESNSNLDVHGYSYKYLLPLLIQSWRKEWKQGDFPFAFVQLPVWENSVAYRYVQEAQLTTLKSVPNTGMAVIYDKTDYKSMLHPRNKKHVGERLADWALSTVYGHKDREAMGPVYQRYEKTGSAIRLYFSGQALQSSNAKELQGFVIADKTGIFQPAKAVLEGKNAVIVSNSSVKDPAAVRYAWGENPVPGNLVNETGLPASPFRTDAWGNDTLEQALASGRELKLVQMSDHWTADAKDIGEWMPATQPAKTDVKNNTVTLSTNRNGRGGVESPYLLNVDFAKKPVIKLNNLQLESAQGWSLVLMTPSKEQYVLRDKSIETGDITVDLSAGLAQAKSRNGNKLNMSGMNNFVILFYAVSDQRKGSLSIGSMELLYEKK